MRFSSKNRQLRADRSPASAADQITESMSKKIADARQAARAYEAGEGRQEQTMHTIMQCAFELYEYISEDEQAEAILSGWFKENKIRVTKNTPNKFVPLLKFIAPNIPKQTIGRSASALTYAVQNEVTFVDLMDFIKQNGGIVNCDKAARESLRPIRIQKAARRNDDKLRRLRQGGKAISSPDLTEMLPEGISSCLLEKKGGQILLLALKSVSDATGYAPLNSEDALKGYPGAAMK